MSLPPGPPGLVAARAPVATGRASPSYGRLLLVFGTLLGGLLGGYLFFDRAFAYLHVPGTPLYVSEVLLALGVVGVLLVTGYLAVPLRHEPLLLVLSAFMLWGLVRTLPGLAEYGADAVRDAALFYYGLFALLVVALLARSPASLERWLSQLDRVTPWLLSWLAVALLLLPFADAAPTVPFTDVSVLSHKPGNAAIAALLVIASMWLLPTSRSHRGRLRWTLVAVVVIAIAGTQNRGGLVAAAVGAVVLLALHPDRRRTLGRAFVGIVLLLAASILAPLEVPHTGVHGRAYSVGQLAENVRSLVTDDSPANLGATVDARQELWSRVLDKQLSDGLLLEGAGFGPNLAAEVSVYDDGEPTLRNPHNSQLHVLARTGLVGVGLWVALWLGWFWRLLAGVGRLEARRLHRRRQVAVLCLTVATAVLVASVFDPVLEGPQVAVLLWTVFGVGVAVTTRQGWFVQDEGPTPGRTGTAPQPPLATAGP